MKRTNNTKHKKPTQTFSEHIKTTLKTKQNKKTIIKNNIQNPNKKHTQKTKTNNIYEQKQYELIYNKNKITRNIQQITNNTKRNKYNKTFNTKKP